jgi:hypothetical protein
MVVEKKWVDILSPIFFFFFKKKIKKHRNISHFFLWRTQIDLENILECWNTLYKIGTKQPHISLLYLLFLFLFSVYVLEKVLLIFVFWEPYAKFRFVIIILNKEYERQSVYSP